MHKDLENRLNSIFYDLIKTIKNNHPLTIIQKLRLTSILINKQRITINSSCEDSFINIKIDEQLGVIDEFNYCLGIVIKNIFTSIIEPKKMDDSLVELEFSEYVTKCIIEFYTYRFCEYSGIEYKENSEYLMFLLQLINGFSIEHIDEELDNVLFRSSIDNLLILSNNGNVLYDQFKQNFSKGIMYTKKEMN